MFECNIIESWLVFYLAVTIFISALGHLTPSRLVRVSQLAHSHSICRRTNAAIYAVIYAVRGRCSSVSTVSWCALAPELNCWPPV